MNYMYRKVLPLVLLFSLSWSVSFAQNQEDIAQFLNAGKADASKLIEAYLEPTVKSLSYGMTGGWYNTAATHKTFGIDFGISVNLAMIPSSESYFNPNDLNLSVTEFEGNLDRPNRGAPTFFGPKDRTLYSSDPDGAGPTQPLTFQGPEGLAVEDEIGFSGVPVPVIQLGIGIIKNTDLKLRFAKAKADGTDLNMFGIGVQHDIKQHIRGIKLLPFDLSVLVAYNSLKGETDLSYQNTGDPDDFRPSSTNGEGVYKFNSFVYQLLISKRLSVVTFYGGVGYSMINTKVNVNGSFDIEAIPQNLTLEDPVSMTIKNKSMRFTAGMRLKLGPIYFVGDYTLQKYKMINVGFGFSIRENKNIL